MLAVVALTWISGIDYIVVGWQQLRGRGDFGRADAVRLHRRARAAGRCCSRCWSRRRRRAWPLLRDPRARARGRRPRQPAVAPQEGDARRSPGAPRARRHARCSARALLVPAHATWLAAIAARRCLAGRRHRRVLARPRLLPRQAHPRQGPARGGRHRRARSSASSACSRIQRTIDAVTAEQVPPADPRSQPHVFNACSRSAGHVGRARLQDQDHRRVVADRRARPAMEPAVRLDRRRRRARRRGAHAARASSTCARREIIEDALTREPATQIARYDDYIHLVLSGCRLVGHKFDLERVDAIMGERFLLTLHTGQPVFLEAVRKRYIARLPALRAEPELPALRAVGPPDRQLPRACTRSSRSASSRCRRGSIGDVEESRVRRGDRARRRPAAPAQGRAAGARGARPSSRRASRRSSARRPSRSSATWSAPSSACCRTCSSIATSCRARSTTTCPWSPPDEQGHEPADRRQRHLPAADVPVRRLRHELRHASRRDRGIGTRRSVRAGRASSGSVVARWTGS